MTDTNETQEPDRPYLLGRTFRLTWRMISSQWSILWLVAITFAISLVWELIPLLWDWRHIVEGIRTVFAGGHGGLPTLPAPSEGVNIANATLEILGTLVVSPYVQAAFIGGLIRAAADRVAIREYWRDGLRYFGRSYLAFISSMILFICFFAIGGLWWAFFYYVVGHGIGGFIGGIGDLLLFMFALPALSLFFLGLFQSSWAGFGRVIRILRQRWGRMHALGWVIILAFAAAVAPFLAGLAAFGLYTHSHMAGPFGLSPLWGGLSMVLYGAVMAVLEPFYIAWFLIYYRRMNGMGLGPWAPANLQAPDASL